MSVPRIWEGLFRVITQIIRVLLLFGPCIAAIVAAHVYGSQTGQVRGPRMPCGNPVCLVRELCTVTVTFIEIRFGL